MRLRFAGLVVRRAASSSSSSKQPLVAPSSNNYGGEDGEYFGDRSAVTSMLWHIRNRDSARLNPADSARVLPTSVVDKTPADSFMEIVLPFSDASLRQQYISPFGHVRIGRLLEDLDAFAGNIAFNHADDGDPTTRLPTIVTASVDKLDLIPKAIDPNKDLKLAGGVTYVGSSSMEIRIDAYQGEGWPRILTTYFTMVALDPTTGKPHRVNRLVPTTREEEQRQKEGERNKAERLQIKSEALHVRLPNQEELQMIHQFFIDDYSGGALRGATLMSDTHQRSLIFCAHQQRNIHNKIFGGYLMRKAFELAFATAFLFAGRRPQFSALGDITFSHPVEIGSLLDLRSAVVYTEKNDMQVHVTARVHDPVRRTVKKTNDFAFSFDLYDDDMQGIVVPPVRPMTYAEAMSYVEGRRNLHRHRSV